MTPFTRPVDGRHRIAETAGCRGCDNPGKFDWFAKGSSFNEDDPIKSPFIIGGVVVIVVIALITGWFFHRSVSAKYDGKLAAERAAWEEERAAHAATDEADAPALSEAHKDLVNKRDRITKPPSAAKMNGARAGGYWR